MSKGIASSGSSRRASEVLVWKEIGQRIRELRGFYVRQEEFAKKIGVSQDTFRVSKGVRRKLERRFS